MIAWKLNEAQPSGGVQVGGTCEKERANGEGAADRAHDVVGEVRELTRSEAVIIVQS